MPSKPLIISLPKTHPDPAAEKNYKGPISSNNPIRSH